MFEWLRTLFDPTGFPARWFCGTWTPTHGWTHIVADVMVFAAYFTIPCILGYFLARRKDLPFPRILLLFALFIASCGFTHLVEAGLFWVPVYRFSALCKVVTAIVSWMTVAALVPLVPRVLELRTPEELEAEIRERQRAERELEARARELQRSNDELAQYAYAASHDLQSPLRTIASYAQLLERRYGDQLDDKAGTYLDYMVDGAVRMQRLIDGLLEMSRIERASPGLSEVDVAAVGGWVRETLADQIAERRATLEFGDLPVVVGDDMAIEQVLLNLVTNALLHGGEAPRVEVSAARSGADDAWVIRVRDHGPGVPEGETERIFRMFARAQGSTQEEGAGIGLALCRKLVERGGGEIRVDPAEGGGAAFSFSVPDRTLPQRAEEGAPGA